MRFTKKFICEFIHNSNLIESIDDGLDKIESIYDMMKKSKSKVDTNLLSQNPQIVNSILALDYVKENQKKRPTIHEVRELHKIAMAGLMPYRDEGCYRAVNVMVGGEVCPNAGKVLQLMHQLMERWEDELTVGFPLAIDNIYIPSGKDPGQGGGIINQKMYTSQYIRHCEFEYIHPFSDGNGRTGRLLYLWDCLYHDKKFKMINFDERSLYYATIKVYKGLLRNTLDVKITKPKRE